MLNTTKSMGKTMKKPDKLIIKLLECKDMAHKMNRWRTYHKLDDALSEAGWEIADILEEKQKIGDKG